MQNATYLLSMSASLPSTFIDRTIVLCPHRYVTAIESHISLCLNADVSELKYRLHGDLI